MFYQRSRLTDRAPTKRSRPEGRGGEEKQGCSEAELMHIVYLDMQKVKRVHAYCTRQDRTGETTECGAREEGRPACHAENWTRFQERCEQMSKLGVSILIQILINFDA